MTISMKNARKILGPKLQLRDEDLENLIRQLEELVSLAFSSVATWESET